MVHRFLHASIDCCHRIDSDEVHGVRSASTSGEVLGDCRMVSCHSLVSASRPAQRRDCTHTKTGFYSSSIWCMLLSSTVPRLKNRCSWEEQEIIWSHSRMTRPAMKLLRGQFKPRIPTGQRRTGHERPLSAGLLPLMVSGSRVGLVRISLGLDYGKGLPSTI
jgi:hypothetical protein